MAYGYLRCKGRIDFKLGLFLDKPEKLPFKLRILLGLAAYELHFLDRVPDYATVSRAVELAKQFFGPRMSGLVNAVLRKIKGLDMHSIKEFAGDDPDELLLWSRFYSCPLWIVRMWKKTYGRELCLKYLRQGLEKPPLGIRELRPEAGVSIPDSQVMLRMGRSILVNPEWPGLNEFLARGGGAVQSFAGQQALHELGMTSWTGPVWDMCAGSGGKTLLMLDHGLEVYSSDVSLKRLKNLSRFRTAYGRSAKVFRASGIFPPLKNKPGTILVDAPCTGLGVLSRRPDIKWKRRPGDVKRLVQIQTGLLDSAARSIQMPGRVVYLTCTLSRLENQGQVDGFLARHKDFVLERIFETETGLELNESFFGAVFKRIS